MNSPSDNGSHSILAGATLIGSKHVRENTCSQDAVLYREYSFGTVLAVADGVGSECYSQYGSESVVRAVHSTFVLLASGHLEKDEIADSIYKKYVDGVDEDFRSHASTTCIYAAHIHGEGLFIGQVGDGICCGRINNTQFILQHKNDEFTNVVLPLSTNNNNEWNEMLFPETEIESIAIMLATDGVSEDILPEKECAFSEYIINHLSKISINDRERYLLNLLNNWTTPKSNDDKTFCFYAYQKDEE